MSATEEEQVPRSAVDLIGQIVGANVDGLARTTDRIIEGLEGQVLDLAQIIVDFAVILDGATVIDRKTETRLGMMRGKIERAYDIIDRKQAST